MTSPVDHQPPPLMRPRLYACALWAASARLMCGGRSGRDRGGLPGLRSESSAPTPSSMILLPRLAVEGQLRAHPRLPWPPKEGNPMQHAAPPDDVPAALPDLLIRNIFPATFFLLKFISLNNMNCSLAGV